MAKTNTNNTQNTNNQQNNRKPTTEHHKMQGVANAAGSEVGVGITGVAGPGGGTAKKPVGMVCFGFYIDGKVTTYTCQFGEIGRNQVRKSSVEFVLSKLLELLDAC